MPLVKKEEKEPVVLVGFNMRKNLREEVKDYCEWAEVKDGKFYITAIEFLLKKDREWQKIRDKNKYKSWTDYLTEVFTRFGIIRI